MMCVQVWQLSDMSLNDKVQSQKGWEKKHCHDEFQGIFQLPFFFFGCQFLPPKTSFGGPNPQQAGDFFLKNQRFAKDGSFQLTGIGTLPGGHAKRKLATIVFQPSNHPFSGCFCYSFQGGSHPKKNLPKFYRDKSSQEEFGRFILKKHLRQG